jgi:hypothetical protein
MTALAVMGYGCAAAHRDWRRIVLGSSGSPNQIGFNDLSIYSIGGFTWGSINNRKYQGINIISFNHDSINTSSGATAEMLIEGTWNASDFSCLEFGRTDGSSFRYYFSDPGLIVAHLAVSGSVPARTQFDWNPPSNQPHGVAMWTLSDVGKTVFVSLQ